MAEVQEIMAELESLGSESIKKIFLNHGAKEPFFGVKVEYLKKIQKRLKKNYSLSLALYDTGNSDAMYLAGLIADEKKMTKADLQHWVKNAYWHMISEYTVPWIAAESAHGYELAMEWIKSEEESIASAGWATLSSIVGIKQNSELDISSLANLLETVESSLHNSKNRVRYTMNGFVIAVGAAVPELTEKAKAIARAIGKVRVNMGSTACKVPDALEY
ncbi:MAG: DNA alkylation repair protein, partial [Saprospiraceae bacterium]|nr:DNA alkylation repair protein [Saprospiraceae bacterium]